MRRKQSQFYQLHLKRWLRSWPGAATSLACIALAVRFGIKDRWPVISALYYITPPHLIALLFLAAALGWLRQRRFRLATGSFCAGMLLGVYWVHGAWYFAPRPEKTGAARVVLWNIARGKMGYPRIMKTIKAQEPDLIALNEAGRNPEETERLFHESFPGYRISPMEGGMMLLIRGDYNEIGKKPSGDGLRFRQYHITTQGVRLNLITVDMVSNLLTSRERAFGRLSQAFSPLLAEPLLIMGDFNTPTDSIYLAPWRENLLNGFESAGRGCSATWPTILPVQAIDQVWSSRPLEVSRFRLHSTLLSDHRMVTFEITTTTDVNTLKDHHDRAANRDRD